MCDDDFQCIFDHFFTEGQSDGSEVGPITCWVGWGTPGQHVSRDYIKELKLLRKRVDWSVEKQRYPFFRRLVDLIYDWQGRKPDLRTIFGREEIEWLLTEDARNEAEPNLLRQFAFMHFVATSDYRDAPDIGEDDGKPVLRRATPIHRAAKQRNIECIYYLLQIYDRFDANYVDEAGLTHFHVVCMTGFKWHAEKFLEHGQDPDCPGYATGDSPLHLALAHRKNEVAELLLRSGAGASSTNAEGLTPLHLICMKNDDDVLLKTFLKISDEKHRSVLIDAPDKWGWTPLHHALACGCKKQIVDVLLRRGADCNLANRDGSTPLHIICERKYDDDLVRIFFEINDDIRRTVQLDAVWKGQFPNLRDIFSTGEVDWLLWVMPALEKNHDSVLDDLLIINFVTRSGYKDKPDLGKDGKPLLDRNTAIHHAVLKENNAVISILWQIYDRFDVNYTNELGMTHFHAACMSGNVNVVKKFLDLGQDPNCPPAEESEGSVAISPLHLALAYRRREVAELLLRRGADPLWTDVYGSTALHVIFKSISYDVEMLEVLLKTVQVDAVDSLGRTPLQWAVASLSPDSVDALLNRGADLSNFVFPTGNYFGSAYRHQNRNELDGNESNVASNSLTIVECLEKRGYELGRSDALTIMIFFADVGKPGKVSDDYCAMCAADDKVKGSLCSAHESTTLTRGFCQRWALDFFLTLTGHRLPILCCEKIIDQLTNEDLATMCVAVEMAVNKQSQLHEAYGEESFYDPRGYDGHDDFTELKRLREKLDWNDEEERYEFLVKLRELSDNWDRLLPPDLRDIFKPEEIDWILKEDVLVNTRSFIDFAIRTGYKDKPIVDEEGKPLLNRSTALHHAARKRPRFWREKIRRLFQIYDRFDVNYTDDGLNHLHVACTAGCEDIVEKFLEAGQDPNCLTSDTGDSPLLLATLFEHDKIVESLLRHDADPNLPDREGLTPLHIVCLSDDDKHLAEMLLEISVEKGHLARIDARDKYGRTPLQLAVANLLPDLIDVLLDYGADLSRFVFPDDFGEKYQRKSNDCTGQEWKVASDALLTVDRLKKRGYELSRNDVLTVMKLFTYLENIVEPLCITEIYLSKFFQRWALKFFLVLTYYRLPRLCCRMIVDQLNNGDMLMMCIAADTQSRMNLMSKAKSGLTHFHAACWSGHDDVVEKFLELGQDPNDCLVPKTGASPLHLAMDSVASEVAEVLLIGGADPNSVDAKGRTPLHYICSRDDVRLQAEIEQLKRLLLRFGSDPNLADKDGSTPLHMIWKNRLVDPCESTETFLKINEEIDVAVQVNVPDKEGNTPLHFSLRSERRTNKSTVELLLRAGADPNLANADGLTPYWLVIGRIRFYDHRLTKWFFEICAEIGRTVRVDARNRLGQTPPLQWAVTNLNVKLVESLLNNGADSSGFCFPTVILKPTPYYKDMFKLSVASSIRIIVENLEKRGYELDRSDALAIVKYFVMYELFEMSEDLYQRQHRLYNDEDIVRRSKRIMMNSSLSLYDLLRLRPEEAEKSLTYTEYCDFAQSDNWRVGEITDRVRRTCAEHLCEKLTRRLFRSWALHFFSELTHYKLPILCCETIIENLKNRDLLNVCLAGT
ncbi:unnamed protein product [Trichogramma brassicae]|uniref:Uncharacterized protein n=1 Tax=Trichogramma brassicae TaxID=86971 RepID=A0A6H5IEP6_9HYME|nr:unnamed protein product [Trichogramma brassicae]